jgi:hypothetical protein
MSNYTFLNSTGNTVDLDTCYNPHTSGAVAPDTGFKCNDVDISNRYNKLGTTSYLKYNFSNYYFSGVTPLNDIFELNLINTISTTCLYTTTLVADGILLQITTTGIIYFNYNLNYIPFVLVGGGGGGGGLNAHDTGYSRQNGANGGSGVLYMLIRNSNVSF